MSDKEAQEAIEAFSDEVADDTDEIENIAQKLEETEEEGSVDDDAEYDEEEAIPIKVNIKKKK